MFLRLELDLMFLRLELDLMFLRLELDLMFLRLELDLMFLRLLPADHTLAIAERMPLVIGHCIDYLVVLLSLLPTRESKGPLLQQNVISKFWMKLPFVY